MFDCVLELATSDPPTIYQREISLPFTPTRGLRFEFTDDPGVNIEVDIVIWNQDSQTFMVICVDPHLDLALDESDYEKMGFIRCN